MRGHVGIGVLRGCFCKSGAGEVCHAVCEPPRIGSGLGAHWGGQGETEDGGMVVTHMIK